VFEPGGCRLLAGSCGPACLSSTCPYAGSHGAVRVKRGAARETLIAGGPRRLVGLPFQEGCGHRWGRCPPGRPTHLEQTAKARRLGGFCQSCARKLGNRSLMRLTPSFPLSVLGHAGWSAGQERTVSSPFVTLAGAGADPVPKLRDLPLLIARGCVTIDLDRRSPASVVIHVVSPVVSLVSAARPIRIVSSRSHGQPWVPEYLRPFL